jgi:ribosomal protein S27E
MLDQCLWNPAGKLEYGFLRVRCDDCFDEKLVAFSCKRRGFCPRCGTKRMVESSALLVDGILPVEIHGDSLSTIR